MRGTTTDTDGPLEPEQSQNSLSNKTCPVTHIKKHNYKLSLSVGGKCRTKCKEEGPYKKTKLRHPI